LRVFGHPAIGRQPTAIGDGLARAVLKKSIGLLTNRLDDDDETIRNAVRIIAKG
jgi:hypothetical protein